MFDLLKEKLAEGPVPIGVADKHGQPLYQYDRVVYDRYNLVILWLPGIQNYGAQSMEGFWIEYDELPLVEKTGSSWGSVLGASQVSERHVTCPKCQCTCSREMRGWGQPNPRQSPDNNM